jgi:hypothetical protein
MQRRGKEKELEDSKKEGKWLQEYQRSSAFCSTISSAILLISFFSCSSIFSNSTAK